MSKVALLIATTLLLLLLNCSNSNSVSQGGAGEVGNPRIVVAIHDNQTLSKSGRNLYCLTTDFNPTKSTPTPYLIKESATLSIDNLINGSYFITIVDSLTNSAVISDSIFVTEDTKDTIELTLTKGAQLQITTKDIPDSGIAYIPGTPFTTTLTSSQKIDFALVPTGGNLPEIIVVDSSYRESASKRK